MLALYTGPKGDCSFYSPPTERPPPNTLPNILYNISLPEKEEQISRILTLLRNQQNEKDFFLYLSLLEICCHLEGTEMIEPLCTWQIRLAKDFIKSLKNSASSELIDTVSSKVDNVFQTFLIDKKPLIEGILLHKRTHGRYPTRSQVTFDQSHLSACTNSEIHILASYLIYNAI
uniref:Uncharacterized protein n=1 Tax=Ciona savignyi TaxID=51511 RepID=H2YD31_CIOSA